MSKKTNTKHTLIIIGLVVLLIGIVAGFVYLYKERTKPQVTASIEITADGFSPQVIQVEPGTRVVWTNRDSAPHQVVSGPYPEQSNLPSLKSEDIGPGGSYAYTFSQKGSFMYYDQAQPTHEGSVEVQ